ncbi:MAG: SH3 domain-containing protein, partial [Roseburia sp.]|nr:SH3 domain-containing protein [Roseburia sp.]
IKVANVAEGDVLNIRKEPNAKSDVTGELAWNDPHKYTIVEEQNGWGKLKSGIGWIKLKYTVRV